MKGKQKVLDFFPVTTTKAVYIDGTNETLNDIINLKEYKSFMDAKTKINSLKADDIIITKGFYQENDRGGAEYKVVETTTPNGLQIHLGNNLYAEYLYNHNLKDVNVLCIGIKPNDSNEDETNGQKLEAVIKDFNKNVKFFFPANKYYIANIHCLSLPENMQPEVTIEGELTNQNNNNNTLILTNGKDFFYDKRKVCPGIVLNMDNIEIRTRELVFNALPSGVMFGSSNGNNIETNFRFNHVSVGGFDYGVYSPAWSCGGSGGEDIRFSVCHYGIYIKQASHCLNMRNCAFNDNRVGIRLGHGGSGCKLVNTHFATGYYGSDRDSFNEFIGIHTKGGLELDGIYYECYNSDNQSEKTILIDYEGWAFGVGPVYINNVQIGYPGWRSTGKFLKVRNYLGAGPEEGNESPISLYPNDATHYPHGSVHITNATYFSLDRLKKVLDLEKPYDSFGVSINDSEIFYDGLGIGKETLVKINNSLDKFIIPLSDSDIKNGYGAINFSSQQSVSNDGYLLKPSIHGNFGFDLGNILDFNLEIKVGALERQETKAELWLCDYRQDYTFDPLVFICNFENHNEAKTYNIKKTFYKHLLSKDSRGLTLCLKITTLDGSFDTSKFFTYADKTKISFDIFLRARSF